MTPSVPDEMTAIEIVAPGAPDMLVPARRPVPIPGPREVLVKVAAAGVNRPDVMQRQGTYPPPPGASPIPGLEIAGEIVAVGPEVTRHAVGDRVMALVQGGGYAEYCPAHEANAIRVPGDLALVEAGAMPETFFTVWSNVFDRGGLAPGEWLLVHGGSSGIGTTAIQLAKAFGANVAVTAGSPDKCEACRRLGADLAIDYTAEDFVAAVKAATDGRGVDLVLDMVGGDYVERNWDAARVEGRIVQIATLRGPTERINFAKLMVKRLVHTGSTLRARDVAFKAAIADALVDKVWPLVEAGAVRPVIDTTFPLAEAAAAHARMEGSGHIGKIVLVTAH